MNDQTLYDILREATAPDKVQYLKSVARWVSDGDYKFTNVLGFTDRLTDDQRHWALEAISSHIAYLNNAPEVEPYYLHQLHQVAGDNNFLHRIIISTVPHTNIERRNDFNEMIVQTIKDFTTDNDYAPDAREIINRWRGRPDLYLVSFSDDGIHLSIGGSKPRKLKNIKESITNILDRQ